MNGVVQSGGTPSLHIDDPASVPIVKPLAGVTVTLYTTTSGAPTQIATAVTDANGAFTISGHWSTSEIFYLTAAVDSGVILMAVLGAEMPETVTVNELTTVAACWCAAQFLSGDQISGDSFALRIAALMSANLVDPRSGESSPVMTSSPNADETNAWRTTLSLANLLAAVVRDPAALPKLLQLASADPKKPDVSSTIQALGSIARHPARHVGGIYLFSKTVDFYQPALSKQPDAWTIVVKVNDSGDDAHMFGGPGNLAFDSKGRVWIANNVEQGTGNGTPWSIVLGPDGHPARNESGGKLTPFSGGGLLGPGFGVAVDATDRIWLGDFGWGDAKPNPGGASLFELQNGAINPISPDPNGYTEGSLLRVQGTLVDAAGNVWLASWGNGRVVVYLGGDPSNAIVYAPDTSKLPFAPFGIAVASDGTAWVTSSASPSCVVHLGIRYNPDTQTSSLIELYRLEIGKTLKGIVIDGAGTIWLASGGDDHVYALDINGNFIGGYQGGGMHGPWGLALDGNDQVWVGDFGPLEVGSVFTGRVTQLAGTNPPAGYRMGDALTPQTGYTLPSEGQQVLLHNGDPLYGPGAPPCHIPMMRTTGLNIDAAGNVWTCNNWKPSFDIDAIDDPWTGEGSNPGGDGMLIWIGIAAPKPVGVGG
jgi:hypothetical protein